MATAPDTRTGTITLTSGSVNFTTTGVNLLTRGHLAGDTIFRNGLILVIDTIIDENLGTLVDPCPAGAAGTAVPVRIRFQPDGSRVKAESRNLIEKLGNGMLESFAALNGTGGNKIIKLSGSGVAEAITARSVIALAATEGVLNGIPMYSGPDGVVMVPRNDLISGTDFDVQVSTLAARAAYDGRPANYSVLVSDVGDGRSAIYSKLTATSGDWSAAAYVTGPVGPAPVITATATTLAAGAAATTTVTPITGGVNLALGIPAGRSTGFPYTWSTTTTDANPGNGLIRANNASLASATFLFVSKTTAAGSAIGTYLLNMASSTNPTIKGNLTLQRISDGATVDFAVTAVTDASTYVKIAITNQSGVTTLTNNGAINFSFIKIGDKGVDGTGVGDMTKAVYDPTNINGDTFDIRNLYGAFSAPMGRLSLTAGVAAPSADVATASTIYYIPCAGEFVPVFDGTNVKMRSIPVGMNLPLTSNTGFSGYHQIGVYDIYAFMLAGVLTLGTTPKWTTNTARQAALAQSNLKGIIVNTSAVTLRHGTATGNTINVAAQQATFLGSFYAFGIATTRSTRNSRLLSNAYNPTAINVFAGTLTETYSYSATAWRLAENNAANQAEVLFCLDGVVVTATNSNFALPAPDTSSWDKVSVGIGVDSVTGVSNDSTSGNFSGYYGGGIVVPANPIANYQGIPGLGLHVLSRLELASVGGSNVMNWYPYAAGSRSHGLRGSYLG